jgi:hypothetical protein
MKSQIVRKRFWTWEGAANATTIDLEPGFGTPKACLIFYTETSAGTDSFDTTLASKTLGVGMIGSTDSGVSSTLRVQTSMGCITTADPTTVRRQHLNNRFIRALNVAGTSFYDMSTVVFLNDAIRITPNTATPQTNGHLDCIFLVLGGSDLRVGIGTGTFSGTAGGTSTLTGLVYQPDLVLVSANITALNAAVTDDFRFCFGAATRSPLKQKGVYLHSEGAAGNIDLGAISSSNTMIYYSTSNAVGPYTHTISGITTGGWTFTSSDAAGGNNNIYNWMALRTNTPTDFALVDLLTSTTNVDQLTGLGISGFVPRTILGAAVNAPTDNTRATTSPGADSIQFFGGNRSNDDRYYMGQGTIRTNSGGTAVTGTGTAFGSLGPGDKIYTLSNSLLGTVNAVTSNIAMTLTANATASFASTNFVYSNPGQFCISFGGEDAGDAVAYSRMSSSLIDMARSTGGTPVTLERAKLTDFTTYNGYNLNFTTTSGTARRGWVVAFKANEASDANRRRIP